VEIVNDVMSLILANVRTAREREGDPDRTDRGMPIGERRLIGMVAKYGRGEVLVYGRHLLDYSAKMMSAALAAIPEGVYPRRRFSG